MSTQPNIIVFFTDQQRFDTVGLHGNPLGLTPHFDRLARAGTFLKNCTTCQPICVPARASLQTGLYASQVGLTDGAIPVEAVTLADHFNAGGYVTACYGKWHLGGEELGGEKPVPRERQGRYQHWLAANTPELGSDAYDCRLFDAQGQDVALPGYRVDALTDAAIRFVCTPRVEPFFLLLSHLEPHQQNSRDDYSAPDGYRELYTGQWMPPDLAALKGNADQQMGGYLGMVKRLDEALGRLVDVLKSTGRLENTVIIFASDHGCHFRTRGHEYKHSCHESSIRIPVFINGPGFRSGGERSEPVSLVDLPPTLLEVAGLPIPETMQGQPIQRLLRGSSDWPRETYVEFDNPKGTGRAIRTGRWKYGVQTDGRVAGGEGGDFPCPEVYREGFLYDLETDPWELENCIALEGYRGVCDLLRERLLQRIERVEGRRPTISPPNDVHFSGQRKVPEQCGLQ